MWGHRLQCWPRLSSSVSVTAVISCVIYFSLHACPHAHLVDWERIVASDCSSCLQRLLGVCKGTRHTLGVCVCVTRPLPDMCCLPQSVWDSRDKEQQEIECGTAETRGVRHSSVWGGCWYHTRLAVHHLQLPSCLCGPPFPHPLPLSLSRSLSPLYLFVLWMHSHVNNILFILSFVWTAM